MQNQKENIELLAELGISVLLFIVGLKLDLRLIKSIGKIALLTGLGQVLFTSIVGYFIGIGLGFTMLHSFYIAVALTFSSTIIIVKLLSDKKEIDSLHGQIAIGFLIVQDIVVIIVMIVLSAIGREGETSLVYDISFTLITSLLLVLLTIVMMKWVIPRLSFFLAKSQELLVLFAIAWAVGLAGLSEYIGFSGEVGAFLAGVSLASSPFKEVIGSRLVSLRDFLLLFFFVNLGANLNMSVIGGQISPAMVFSAFVLVGNPIIVLVIMGWMGYRKRTAFLAGLTVAQISEFSLIFAGLGLAVGHINEEIVGLITLVGLITIGLSTYLILYSYPIFNFLSPVLSVFERKKPYREEMIPEFSSNRYDVLIIGLGRFGSNIARQLDLYSTVKYLGVDFDPNIVKSWQKLNKDVHYGDIEDPDLWDSLPLKHTNCIINTVSDYPHAVSMMKSLKSKGYEGHVYITANRKEDYELMKDIGADQVLWPHQMAASNFYDMFIDDKK